MISIIPWPYLQNAALWLGLCGLLSACGCQLAPSHCEIAACEEIPAESAESGQYPVAQASHEYAVPLEKPPLVSAPHELAKVVLPTYVIEPPDILVIEALRVVPKPPYRLQSLDVLGIDVQGTLPDAPIAGAFPIEPGGVVSLGAPYRSVRVAGLTVPEAREAIEEHLRLFLRDPIVTVSLLESAGEQQIAGDHLVAPDGTVNLGSYGSVSVVGKTVLQAKYAIESHLAQFLENPEVSVSVFAYNSKVYYIITEGAGLGDRVFRFPITGNETVLDAISNINGLDQVSSKRIWIARPAPHTQSPLILPVDWQHITAHAHTSSNYQLLPGDRLFIAEDKFVALDNALAKLFAPVERLMGFTTLSVGTATRLSGSVLRGGGNPLRGGVGGVIVP